MISSTPSIFPVGHSWIGNTNWKLQNYNYNWAECPHKYSASTNFYFLSKLSESGIVNRRKRKKEEGGSFSASTVSNL